MILNGSSNLSNPSPETRINKLERFCRLKISIVNDTDAPWTTLVTPTTISTTSKTNQPKIFKRRFLASPSRNSLLKRSESPMATIFPLFNRLDVNTVAFEGLASKEVNAIGVPPDTEDAL